MTPTKNATQQLLDRMLSFVKGSNFDGYPTMTCEDEGLIYAAVDENEAGMRAYEARTSSKFDNNRDPTQYIIYLASEHAKTPEQFDNARRFIADFLAAVWACNMQEGSNPVYAARSEIEGNDGSEYSLV